MKYGERQSIHIAIAALRDKQERDHPKPLTLEELRRSHGGREMSKTDELIHTIEIAKAALEVVAEDPQPNTGNLDEIAEIVKRDAEVVRCGECKFRCDYTDGHHECRLWPPVPMSYRKCELDDFCSRGERREDDHGA